MEKVDLKKRLDKMEEKKIKKLEKQGVTMDDSEESEVEEKGRIKEKKAKNLAKMMKYHQRKRREFKQREPMNAKHAITQ